MCHRESITLCSDALLRTRTIDGMMLSYALLIDRLSHMGDDNAESGVSLIDHGGAGIYLMPMFVVWGQRCDVYVRASCTHTRTFVTLIVIFMNDLYRDMNHFRTLSRRFGEMAVL